MCPYLSNLSYIGGGIFRNSEVSSSIFSSLKTLKKCKLSVSSITNNIDSIIHFLVAWEKSVYLSLRALFF